MLPSLRIFQFALIHTVKGFSIVSEAEVDVFLECTCFFCDPVNVGNLISGSSAFSKSSLYIWKFLVQVLLKPSFKDFEYYLCSKWNEHIVQYLELLKKLFKSISVKRSLYSFGGIWKIQFWWEIAWPRKLIFPIHVVNSCLWIYNVCLHFCFCVYLFIHSVNVFHAQCLWRWEHKWQIWSLPSGSLCRTSGQLPGLNHLSPLFAWSEEI